MSSEIITKNDLKAILDTALPTQPVLVDSGWKTATLSSAFTLYSDNEPVKYRRVGKLVEIRGTVKPTAEIAGSDTWYTIFTLPLGYRPSGNRIVLQQGSGASIWLSSVDASGNVSFARYRSGASYATASTSVWLNLHLDFLIDADDWPVTPVTCADYVVEQGVDGIWTYRKWNSGISECWGLYTATLTNYASSVGSASLYGYKTESISFPTDLFIEEPIPTFSAYVGSGFAMTGTLTSAISATNCTFYAVATSSGSQSTKWYLRAEGKWK